MISESKVSILSWIVSQLRYAEDSAYSYLNDLFGFRTKWQFLTLPELQKCAENLVFHYPNDLEASVYNKLVQFKSVVDAGDDQVQSILHLSKLLSATGSLLLPTFPNVGIALGCT